MRGLRLRSACKCKNPPLVQMGWLGVSDHRFSSVLVGSDGVQSCRQLVLSNHPPRISGAPLQASAPYARRTESEGQTADGRTGNGFSLPILCHTAAGRDKRQVVLSWVQCGTILTVDAMRSDELLWAIDFDLALHLSFGNEDQFFDRLPPFRRSPLARSRDIHGRESCAWVV